MFTISSTSHVYNFFIFPWLQFSTTSYMYHSLNHICLQVLQLSFYLCHISKYTTSNIWLGRQMWILSPNGIKLGNFLLSVCKYSCLSEHKKCTKFRFCPIWCQSLSLNLTPVTRPLFLNSLSDLGPKLVRLTSNETNLGFLKVIFSVHFG